VVRRLLNEEVAVRGEGAVTATTTENFVYRQCCRSESHKIIGKRLRASARDVRIKAIGGRREDRGGVGRQESYFWSAPFA